MPTHRIAGNARQGYEVHTAWGISVSFGATDLTDATVTLPAIRSVGVDDLRDVQSHCISHVARSTSHVVRFVSGGCVEFAYNDRGELLELSAHSVRVRIDAQGRMSFGPYRATQPAEPTASH